MAPSNHECLNCRPNGMESRKKKTDWSPTNGIFKTKFINEEEKVRMDKEEWFFRPAFYITSALYFILGYITLGWGEKWAATLFPEDHYFENVGAISLFVASAISFYIFGRALKTRGVS